MAATRNSPPAELTDRVAAFFVPRLSLGRRVCVALSGGRDSVALLHLLAEARRTLPLTLSAFHIHHGLSANADAWSGFCAERCRQLEIPLKTVRVDVADDCGEGLEAAARRARYAAFGDCDADWLALAHHRDDQAETLLLNLLRGAGAEGLAGMPEERRLAPAASLRLVRPLLAVSREQLDAWLTERQLTWVEDESNADSRLRRNFLRNEVMPLLGSVFPQPGAMLARSASLLAAHAELAEELAMADAAVVVDGDALVLKAFNALSPARRANLLRSRLRARGWRMPDARYLAEMLRQLAQASADSAPLFPLEEGALRVHSGRLHFVAGALNEKDPLDASRVVVWSGEASLPWSGGTLHFSAGEGVGISRHSLAGGLLTVRRRQGGESLQPDVRRPRRALKKLLQESAIAPWQRTRLPLLWNGDSLVWVAGIGVDCRFAAKPGEAGVLPIWESGAAG